MMVVVYKKTKSGKKYYMDVFEKEKTPDVINNLNAKKPLIPHKYHIIELGLGKSLIKKWQEKYNIKKPQIK